MPDSTGFAERRPSMDVSDDRAVNHSLVSSTSFYIQNPIDGSPTTTTLTSLVSLAEAPSRSCSSQACTLKLSESKRGRLESPKVVVPIQSGTKQRYCVRRSAEKVAGTLSNSQGIQSPSHQRPKGGSATPQPQREQAVRHVKPFPSIEESAQKPFDRYAFLGTPSTPSTTRTRRYKSESAVKHASDRRRREDEDYPWAPPSISSEEMSFGESPIPPYGCSSRHHHTSEASSRDISLTQRMPRSSPDRQASVKVTKRESTGSSPLAAQNGLVIVKTSPSPSIYNSDRRRRRLEQNGFVQQPAVDFAEHRLAKARKEAALMEAIIEEGRRKQEEKAAEYCSDQPRPQSFEGTRKRELKDEFEASQKRQKTSGLITTVDSCTNNDTVDGPEVASVSVNLAGPRDSQMAPQTTTEKRLEENQEHMNIKVEQMVGDKLVAMESSKETAVDDSEGSKSKFGVPSHIRDRALPPCGKPKLTSCAEHGYHRKAQTTRRWYNPQHRRELTMPIQSHPCTCQYLPGYFTRQGLLMPRLKSFPGGKLEFMTHVEQISNCHGHSDRLRNGCRIILEREKNAERYQGRKCAAKDKGIGYEDTIEWAKGFLSSDPFCDPSSSSSTANIAANTSNLPGYLSQYPTAGHSTRLRQQSSIEPTRFYGQPPKFRRPYSIVEPSQSLPGNSIPSHQVTENLSTPPQLPVKNDKFGHRATISSPSEAEVSRRKNISNVEAHEKSTEADRLSLLRRTKKLKKSNSAANASGGFDGSPVSSKMRPTKRVRPGIIQPLSDTIEDQYSSSLGNEVERGQMSNEFVAPQEPIIEDDWRPIIDDDDEILRPTPPHSSPLSPDQDIMQSRHHSVHEASPADEEQDSAPAPSRATPPIPSTGTIRNKDFTTQRHRHQSLPAKLSSSTNAKITTSMPSPRPAPQRQPLQTLSPNLDIVRSFRDMEASIKQMQQTITQNLLPSIIRHAQPAPPAAPNPSPPPTEAAEQQPTQGRRRPSLQERKRRQPELPRDVPRHQRLSDRRLIEIGKRLNRYQRHVGAPYAFSWRGRLFAEYDYLLTRLNADGSHGWDAKEKARVKNP